MQYQQNNNSIFEFSKLNKDYSIKYYHGADKKYSFICIKHKIFIPKVLEKQLVQS